MGVSLVEQKTGAMQPVPLKFIRKALVTENHTPSSSPESSSVSFGYLISTLL